MQAAAAGRDKDWWAQKTNPSFPSAPIADYSSTTTSASAAAAPKQNPFLKGGSQEDTRVRDAPLTGDGRQTGDKKDPRKEFEAGLKGAVRPCLYLYGSTHFCTILSKAWVGRGFLHTIMHTDIKQWTPKGHVVIHYGSWAAFLDGRTC